MTQWMSSVMTGAATVPAVRFCDGDHVEVLRACRLPNVEEVIGDGIIARIGGTEAEPLYFVSGFLAARTARQLRLVSRAR